MLRCITSTLILVYPIDLLPLVIFYSGVLYTYLLFIYVSASKYIFLFPPHFI